MAELLAPAGNLECLDAAVNEGADAVYLGLREFNARLRTSNFSFREFEAAVFSLHKMKKKVYVAVNTVFCEREAERLYRFLAYLERVGPDALIVQDFGVIRMCREFFPNLVLHASTQMNVASAAAVNLLGKEGVKRVVLSRELSLCEIKKIKEQTSCFLEVFVHGSLCASESGLCLFSSFLGGKSANRGMCAQACRRYYTAQDSAGEGGGYYFSPCDLQLIEKIPELVQAGVSAFKIEGRMKSAEYVGSVTAAYRYVLDNWAQNKKEAVAAAKRMLASDFARTKSTYWYDFKTAKEGVEGAAEKILNPEQAGGTGIYLGKISATKPLSKKEKVRLAEKNFFEQSAETDGEKNFQNADFLDDEENLLQESFAEENSKKSGGDFEKNPRSKKNSSEKIFSKNNSSKKNSEGVLENFPKPCALALIRGGSYDADAGDSIRIHKSEDGGRFSHKVKIVQTDAEGKRWIDVPAAARQNDDVYLLQTKTARRYKHVLQGDLSRFNKQPRDERLAVMDLTPVQKNELSFFPQGLYVQVSSVQDVFTAQSVHPVKIIIELNFETLPDLLFSKTALPVSKNQIILAMDPFCPQETEENLSAQIEVLADAGFKTFLANNIAHIPLLKKHGRSPHIIAGPYLYSFNRWAVSWLENRDISAFVSPYENSRKNLEETFEKNVRPRVLIPIYAYPALFRMRFKLPARYDFTYFSDKEDEAFKVNSTEDGSFVMPEAPFSIADKTDILLSAGFSRFLLDFSKTRVRKTELRRVFQSYQKKQPLEGVFRFNWKEGFFSRPRKKE